MKFTSSLIIAAGLLATSPAYCQIISPYSARSISQSPNTGQFEGRAIQPVAEPMRAITTRSYIAPTQSLPSLPEYSQPSYGSYPYPIYVGAPYIPTPGYAPSGGATYALPGAVSGFTNGNINRYQNTSSYFFGSGYSFPYYCPSGYSSVIYQSAYSVYDGFPTYFYAPEDSVIVIGGAPTVFDPYSGQYYVLNSDPFDNAGNVLPTSETEQNSSGVLPDGWSAAFAPIGQAWVSDNIGVIDNYLPLDGSGVQVGVNGQYNYSIDANDYNLMTRDAMSHLATTDFRFTDARVRPNGSATAWAVQQYRTASGMSGTVYLAYTLRRDPTLAGGYRLEGVDSSRYPLTQRQSALAARANQTTVLSYGH